MEWLENCIGRQSETELIDLQDSWVNIEVEQILSRKDRKRLRKKWVKSKRTHSKKPSVRKDRSVNREHMVPRCKSWSNHADNIKMSDVKAHANKHWYLGVQLFHEQLITIMNDNFQTLHKETRKMVTEEIEQILDYYLKWGELYSEKCFTDKNKIPKKLNKTVDIY